MLALAGCGGGDDAPPDAAMPRDAATPPADAPTIDASMPSEARDAAIDAGSEVPAPPNRVVPIYIAASDADDALIARHVAIYEVMLRASEDWYAERMTPSHGPITFRHDAIRVMRGHYTRAEWETFSTRGFVYPDGMRTAPDGGCSMWYGAQHELEARGLLAEAGLPPLGSPGVLYYALIGGGVNGSCGAAGYLGASEAQLLENTERECPTGRYAGGATNCAPVGAVAHELGHGFGLPHGMDRPMCSNGPSLMDVWWEFDRAASLCDEDREDLARSGYFGLR